MVAEYRAKRKGEWHLLEEYDCFGGCFIFDGFQLADLLLPIFISSLSLSLSLSLCHNLSSPSTFSPYCAVVVAVKS